MSWVLCGTTSSKKSTRLERSVAASNIASILETLFKASMISMTRTSSSPTENIAWSFSNKITSNKVFKSPSSNNVSKRYGKATSRPSLIRTLLTNT